VTAVGIGAADAVAVVMLASLMLYVLLGGADFGGGIWDLFAAGERAAAQRATIERAIAPIWEANHVWLILLVVLLFTAFPAAYSAGTIALHVPLTLMLLGVVARGSAFVFRQYSTHSGEAQRRWGRVFAIASVGTPLCLGVSLGAVTSGDLHFVKGVPQAGFFAPWLKAFPLVSGLLTCALFAFLAATYLTNEADGLALKRDFRARALIAGAAVFLLTVAVAAIAARGAPRFSLALRGSPWAWPLGLAIAAAGASAAVALVVERYRFARGAAAAQAVLLVAAWGEGQRPYLIAPDLTIAGAAAPARTLTVLLLSLAVGGAILFPSLAWLFRVFKASERPTT
jgi:cytochrome d ubiquinol oxidase subunit II